MELSCEVRGSLWVPRDWEPGLLSGLPQGQSQLGWSLSVQLPRGLLGGMCTSQSLDADPKREKGVRVMCRGRSCREPPRNFPQLCALYLGLHCCSSLFCHSPTLLLLHLKLCFQACQTAEIIEASPPTPSPALLSWNQPRFSSQSFALSVACGFPHSNLWFGVALRMVSVFSLSLHPPAWFLYRV